MYTRNENSALVYYKFVGWVKDRSKFMEVMDDDIKIPSEVRKYLLDEVYSQAVTQGLDKSDGTNGWEYPDFYLETKQQILEEVAKASDMFSNKLWRTKEKQMFVFGPWLGGVYVFKQIS